MAEKWLVVRGLTLSDYISHLRGSGKSDGLELWLSSMATNCPVNVFNKDLAWSTGVDGLDFSHPSILLTLYSGGFWCKEAPDDTENIFQDNWQPVAAAKRVG